MDKNDEYGSQSGAESDDERPADPTGDFPLLPQGSGKAQPIIVGNNTYKKMTTDGAVVLELGEVDESEHFSGSDDELFDHSLIIPMASSANVLRPKDTRINMNGVDDFEDSNLPEVEDLLESPIRPKEKIRFWPRARGNKLPLLSGNSYIIQDDAIELQVMNAAQHSPRDEGFSSEESSSLEEDDKSKHHASSDSEHSEALMQAESPRAMVVVNQPQIVNDVQRRELFRALDTLAELLPEFTEYSLRDVAVGSTALSFAAVASYYNVKFAGTFAGLIAKDLNWGVQATNSFKHYCQVMGFAINVPINWRSILGAIEKFRDDLSDRWKKNRMRMPMDSFFKSLIVIMGVIAMIGAIPNVVFSLEDLPANLFLAILWGSWMTIIQLVTIGALNLRGLTNIFDLDKEKNASVQHKRHKELSWIRKCTTEVLGNLWGDDYLERMSNGQLVKSPSGFFTGRNIVGILLWSGVLPYAGAVGYSVYTRLMAKALGSVGGIACNAAFHVSGSIGDVLTVISIPVLAAIAGGLKFILLGKSNYNFVQSTASATDQSLFKMGNHEVVTSSVVSRGWRKIFSFMAFFIGAWVCFGSLGSPSEVSEKYFWCDQGGITLLYAFIIGAVASFILGSNDGRNVLDLVGSETKKRADKYLPTVFRFLPAYDPVKRFGDSLDGFLLKIAYVQSAKTNSSYARDNLVPFNSRVRLDATQAAAVGLDFHQGGEIAHMERREMDGTGYSASNKYLGRKIAYVRLRNGAYPGLFEDWLDYRRERANTRMPPAPVQVEVLEDLNETPAGNYLLELDEPIPATQPRTMLDSDDEENSFQNRF